MTVMVTACVCVYECKDGCGTTSVTVAVISSNFISFFSPRSNYKLFCPHSTTKRKRLFHGNEERTE